MKDFFGTKLNYNMEKLDELLKKEFGKRKITKKTKAIKEWLEECNNEERKIEAIIRLLDCPRYVKATRNTRRNSSGKRRSYSDLTPGGAKKSKTGNEGNQQEMIDSNGPTTTTTTIIDAVKGDEKVEKVN